MHALAEAVADGAPSWLNLVVLLLAWDSIKLGVLSILEALRAMMVAVNVRSDSRSRHVKQASGLGVDDHGETPQITPFDVRALSEAPVSLGGRPHGVRGR